MDEALVDAQINSLEIYYADFNNENCVTEAVELITSEEEELSISWHSSDETIISTSGAVTRPEDKNREVILTATVSCGRVEKKKKFSLNVIKRFEPIALKNNLEEELIELNNGELPEIIVDENDVMAELITDSHGFYRTDSLSAGHYSLEIIDNRVLEEEEDRYKNDKFNIKIMYVQVYSGDSDQSILTYHIPKGTGYYWTVFQYDSKTKKITPINEVGDYPMIRERSIRSMEWLNIIKEEIEENKSQEWESESE